jgi:hypothetical protein
MLGQYFRSAYSRLEQDYWTTCPETNPGDESPMSFFTRVV